MKSQNSEETLPFREIPEHPESYTSGAVAARMIEGLGFRYYWATEGLRDDDLNFQPSEGARSTMETVQHIYGLTQTIKNAVLKETTEQLKIDDTSFEVLRQQTLLNLKSVSDALRDKTDLHQFNLKRANQTIPFWNFINGPISDAIWHCGQIASFRRVSGNPISSKVSFFNGTIRD